MFSDTAATPRRSQAGPADAEAFAARNHGRLSGGRWGWLGPRMIVLDDRPRGERGRFLEPRTIVVQEGQDAVEQGVRQLVLVTGVLGPGGVLGVGDVRNLDQHAR